MKKSMSQIYVTGEALIDFVPVSSDLGDAYAPRCGGSTYNVAKAAARQNAKTAFIGPISTDLFGDRLVSDLSQSGVDLSLAERVDYATTLAFVEYNGQDARYAFFNALTATQLTDHAQTHIEARSGDILHAGSISLIDNPGATNIVDFVEQMSDTMIVSLDPNARPGMITDLESWRERINRLIDVAAIVKLSDEDLEILEPGANPKDYAAALLKRGVRLAIITLGPDGAFAQSPSGSAKVAGYSGHYADTVGAGDTVMGSVLAALVGQSRQDLAMLDDKALGLLLKRAMAAAWMNCQSSGCNPPDFDALEAFLAKD